MPTLNLIRRKGPDIERFYVQDRSRDQEPPTHIRGEYLIPIRR
jgi:AraC family transcriptional activator of mar-sox-rob regulon